MIQINIGDRSGREGTDDKLPIPALYLNQARWARRRAIKLARDIKSADRHFKTLPKGRTLTSMLADKTIWINYSTEPEYGFTYRNKDLWICTKSFKVGRWTVLATLIHELAHINGVVGEHNHAAEQVLVHCGLGKMSEFTSGVDDPFTPYNPTIHG